MRLAAINSSEVKSDSEVKPEPGNPSANINPYPLGGSLGFEFVVGRPNRNVHSFFAQSVVGRSFLGARNAALNAFNQRNQPENYILILRETRPEQLPVEMRTEQFQNSYPELLPYFSYYDCKDAGLTLAMVDDLLGSLGAEHIAFERHHRDALRFLITERQPTMSASDAVNELRGLTGQQAERIKNGVTRAQILAAPAPQQRSRPSV